MAQAQAARTGRMTLLGQPHFRRVWRSAGSARRGACATLRSRSLELEIKAGAERWTMITELSEGFRVGDPVPCALNAEALLFFDPATGRRIG